MAAFNVLQDFRVPDDAALKHLHPGGIYIAGDVINGLSAAEAGELLKLVPDGTFEAADEEARSVVDWFERNGGWVSGVSGDIRPKRK